MSFCVLDWPDKGLHWIENRTYWLCDHKFMHRGRYVRVVRAVVSVFPIWKNCEMFALFTDRRSAFSLQMAGW